MLSSGIKVHAAEAWEGDIIIPDSIVEEDNPEKRMAYNIYSNPVLSQCSGRYEAFSIDFCSDYAPTASYWALCNWRMDTSALEKDYTITDRGGAYAGLQNTVNGKIAIMSFWEIHYSDKNGQDNILRAHRIYPDKNEHYFGGEGEGTNCLIDYEWKTNSWYRMLLRCYDDKKTGNTIVEQWVCDLSGNTWTKISAFDTGLKNSCFLGNMSQFMENYSYNYCDEIRTFRIKNIAVKEYGSKTWTPINSSVLSVDTWSNDKKGNYSFGSSGEYIWGITCGSESGIDLPGIENYETLSFSSETPDIPSYVMGKVEEKKEIFYKTELTEKRFFYIDFPDVNGKLKYKPTKKTKAAGIKVNSKGKVTIPKNCKKGTYKITVKAIDKEGYSYTLAIIRIVVK